MTVRAVSDESVEKITEMAARNMKLAATIQDGMVWLADDSRNLEIEIKTLMQRGEPVF